VLALAILVSLLLHAVVLSLRFGLPDPRQWRSSQSLEVVIVNSKTRSKPVKAEALAQANLDGGGNTDENRRAKSPLPNRERTQQGDSLREAQRRVQELESVQKQLLTQNQAKAAVVSQPSKAEVAPEPPKPAGSALASSSLAMIRNMEAQVSRSLDEYSKRPKKTFVGARAQEYRFAQYVEDWRQKVERIGNLNYPDGARGKAYGSLRLSVSILPDGSIDRIDLEQSSGQKVLDAAAERIVRMAAPYGKFPPDIRRDTDVLVITRTWHFEQGDRLQTD
jgi:protein TonB